MPLELTIIQPSRYYSKTDRRVLKTKRRAVVPLVLPYLAALTPPGWNVKLIDEQIEDIAFDRPTDLVAITAWTVHSTRAYDVAAKFRERGVPVIMGGPHVFFFPDEAAEHCDAIGIGEAEPIWAEMLAGAAAGRLRHAIAPRLSPRSSLRVCQSRASISWTCRGTARSKPSRCNPRAAARSFAISAPSGFISARATAGGRLRTSWRMSGTPAVAIFSSARAISAASAPARWS